MKIDHRLGAILFTLFVLVHDPSGDRVATYEGVTQATIASMMNQSGLTYEMITADAYAAFVAANTHPPLTAAELLALLRSDSIASLTVGKDSISELQRAILLTLLDELNILRQRDRDRSTDIAASTSLADLKTRWAARSALSDRTVSQAETAVQNKISSGGAD